MITLQRGWAANSAYNSLKHSLSIHQSGKLNVCQQYQEEKDYHMVVQGRGSFHNRNFFPRAGIDHPV